jgi:hypothetical protein
VLKGDSVHKAALFNLASIFHMLECPSISINCIERLLVISIREKHGGHASGQEDDDNTSHSFLWALANHEFGRRSGE